MRPLTPILEWSKSSMMRRRFARATSTNEAASDQARCIVRAGGLREIDVGGPRLVRKFRLVVHATPSAFGKEWCPVGAAERHPARMPD
jgi:hypothetical protein